MRPTSMVTAAQILSYGTKIVPAYASLISSSDGSLRYQDNELILSQNPVSLRAADLNGDNLGDLVVGFGSTRAVQAYLGFR